MRLEPIEHLHGELVALEQIMIPAGPHLNAWWKWCYERAHRAYSRYILANIRERESTIPTEIRPIGWEQMNAWMRPKVLEASPDHVKE